MLPTESTQLRPDHVPPSLFWDHSLSEFTHQLEDPFLAASRLHDGPDIFWARDANLGRPGWVVTRQVLQQEVFTDHERFSAERENLKALLGVNWRLNPLEFDPPTHRTYRRLLDPLFSPKAVSALSDAVRDASHTLIEEFVDRGGCEFMHDFSRPFPSYIFLALMGMPKEMANQFLEWEEALLRESDNMKRVAAARGILHYLEGFIAEQKKTPGTELMQGLMNAKVDGRPLDDGEIMGMVYLLYIGGLDTVLSTLGWIMRHLAVDADLQQRLRARPEDIPQAVDEFLRAFPVVETHRRVTQDINFHGVEMRKDDEIYLPLYLAGRDPTVFDDPHKIDVERESRHPAFGTGVHLCLGRYLAKREIATVLETFLASFQNIRVPSGEQYEYHTGATLGIDRLPLTWDRAIG